MSLATIAMVPLQMVSEETENWVLRPDSVGRAVVKRLDQAALPWSE